jgi:hypothetical protein
MDIEGSEFSVLDNVLTDRIRIEEMLIDVHHFLLPRGKILLKGMLADLKRSGFRIFESTEDKTLSCIDQSAIVRRVS